MTARLPVSPKGRPLVLGHRGARAHAVENTMHAFELALDHGADGVEIDVRMSADGALFIAHDEELPFEGPKRGAALRNLSSSQLDKLRLSGGHKIPTLRDVLEFQARSGALINVELKGDVPNASWMCERAAREIRVHGGHGLVLSSFSPLVVRKLTLLLPNIPTALLFDKSQSLMRRLLPLDALGATGAHPEDATVDHSLVQRLKSRSKFIGVWTVNDTERARTLAQMRVDVLISDDPRAILSALTSKT